MIFHNEVIFAEKMLSECQYIKVDDEGLHLTVKGEPRLLEVDNVIICAGQIPARELVEGLTTAGVKHQLIGGADVASELDAKRAIQQGTQVASRI